MLFVLILCTFCTAQNRSFKPKLNQKRSQNWDIFAKNAVFFSFFLRPPSKVTNFNTSTMPPFWKFFITYVEKWTKTFCKKTGRPGQSETGQPAGRPAGQPAMILKFTGRVGSRKSWPVPSLVTPLLEVSVCKKRKQPSLYFMEPCGSSKFQLKRKLLVIFGILLKNSNAVLTKSAMLMVDWD